ncbi:MAG TPA: ABC transporter permease [Bryobacteraceae bacterium]|nr:ABC transporter permease [Bryobacteraceae bacterium]
MFADLSMATRVLRRSPGFTLLVVLLLSLGIGTNTAMFSILDAWLLQPLPFPEPYRLAIVLKSEASTPTEPKIFPFYRDLDEWARHNSSFANLAGMFWRSFETADGGDNIFGVIVTANLFDTVEVKPELGRTFRSTDLDGPPVAVITHELWQNRLGGARDILGKSIVLSSKTYQIAGVMPPRFTVRMIEQSLDPQVFALIQRDEPLYAAGGLGPVAAIGRLRPGVSIGAAQSDLASIQHELDQRYRDNPKGYTVLVTNLQKDNTRSLRALLWLSAAAVGLVLLIVCANVGSLLLGRTLQRQREMAIRFALGSGRWRIVRQLLTESGLLAAASAIMGLLFAYAEVRLFQTANPFGRTPVHPIALDARALAFTMIACIASALIFGLAPAFHASRADLNEVMKAAGRGIAGGRAAFRARALMVTGQIALSLVLVVGAALLIETLARLQSQPLGFHVEGVTVAGVHIPKNRWNDLASRRLILDRLVDNLKAMPGVRDAAIGNSTPLGGGLEERFSIEGQPEPSEESAPKADRQYVTSGYFSTLQIPVLAGRGFQDSGNNSLGKEVVVNQSAAKRWFKGRNAVGAHVKFPKDKEWRTVVGVVGDTSYTFYNTIEWLTEPRILIPSKQDADERLSPVAREVYAVIRGPQVTADQMRAVLHTTDPALHLDRVQTLQEEIDEAIRQPRLRTQALGAFAGLSLLLAAIGIYGVMSQSVIQRKHEIGIRMALGAGVNDVIRMVVGQGLRLAVAGITAGILAALAATRILASMLYGAKPTDPLTFTTAALILLTAAALAAILPARAAARVDPMKSLRDE